MGVQRYLRGLPIRNGQHKSTTPTIGWRSTAQTGCPTRKNANFFATFALEIKKNAPEPISQSESPGSRLR
jgi:hypothetical protein